MSYVKRPSLLNYESTSNHPEFLELILSDIRVCEILRRNPHPNIAQYLGCLVNKEGRVSGLVFAKYPITLTQILREETPFDRPCCLHGIEAGISHMHGLALIHNDTNPANIMMVGDDMKPVVIDFESCKPEGEELGIKGGTSGWSLDADVATRENDLYGLSKLRETLLGEKNI